VKKELELVQRSKLTTQVSELGGVVSTLASSPQARNRFLQDPAAFLNQNQVPVDACKLGAACTNQTSETTSACSNAFVAVDCWVAVATRTNTDCDVVVAVCVIGPEQLTGQGRTVPVTNLL
jgi:hypothetical protein